MTRSSTYTNKTAEQICERLADGEPLAAICRSDGMPAKRTVYDWRMAHPEFDVAYLAARDDGFDSIAERTRQTARGTGESSGDVQRDKLIIDTDLKLLAKWDPRRYGEKLDLSHSGTALKSIEVVFVSPDGSETSGGDV